MSNIPKADRTIIPNVEWQPERVYCQIESSITCYKIKECNTSITDIRDSIIIGDILFSFTFVEKEDADSLMDDLYYGEYTGA